MAENKGFDVGDHLGPAGTFSQLLFSADRVVGLQDLDHSSTYSTFSASKPPKMLCFGKFGEEAETGELLFPPAARTKTCQKSGLTCSDSSSTSSINDTKLSFNAVPKSNKRRNGSVPAQCKSASKAAPAPATQRNCKKSKTDNPAPTKARKEKLGERIATLQQLVSPFGKTDTASVLHEAMGYIRFLHEQVQVLCSPYLQGLPSSSSAQHQHQPEEEEGGSGECDTRKDLRSRGLCLVPVESAVHVDNSNGADFWSPAMCHSAVVSSTTATTKL